MLFLGLIVAGSFPYLWWLWAAVAVVWVIRWWWKKRRALPVSMDMIDALDGPQFEQFLVLLFQRLGYRAVHTGRAGDFGADLVVESKTERVAVQAKNYDTGKVGNDAVQQAIAAATYYDCSGAMVVTNSRFTAAAMEQARGSNLPVSLVDRDALWELVQKVG